MLLEGVVQPDDLPADFSPQSKGEGVSVLDALVSHEEDTYALLVFSFDSALNVVYHADSPTRILSSAIIVERDEDVASLLFKTILAKELKVTGITGVNETVVPIQIPAFGKESMGVSRTAVGKSGGVYTTVIVWRYRNVTCFLELMSIQEFPPENVTETLLSLVQVVQARLEAR